MSKSYYADVYLRDLKQSLQEEYIRQWKNAGKKDLLKANDNNEDIKVGHYLKNGTEEII